MGRTHRKRTSHKNDQSWYISLEDKPEIIALNKWIKSNGFTKHKKIRLANFPNTGRGIMALENINAGDLLMEVPFQLVLNISTILDDSVFISKYFKSNEYLHNKTCSFQGLLSFYITYLKIIHSKSFWSEYIQTFPTFLTVPYFCSDEQISTLDDSIIFIIQEQKAKISELYTFFKNILSHSMLQCQFENEFTREIFEWAYFIVNSRCIYLDPNILLSSIQNTERGFTTLSQYLSDEPNLGLIPFLDMFNHSLEAKTDAKLNRIQCNDISSKSLLHNNYVFKLSCLTSYLKYDQIYISYGQHGNLKLVTEYGFCLPSNKLTNLKFNYDFIFCNCPNIEREKYVYVMKHYINKDLFIDSEGFSYNFLRLLFILSNDEKKTWDKKIYSCEFCKKELNMIYKLAKPILSAKKHILRDILMKSIKYRNGTINFEFCIDLMREYISLLERVLLTI